MSLNNIVSPEKILSLGSGLDFRLNKYNTNQIQAVSFYGSTNNVDATERMVDSNLTGSEIYSFPTIGIATSVASTDNSDTGTIQIVYYQESTSEEATTEFLTLNGQTKVNLSNNMFRLVRIAHVQPGINGTIWVGPTSDPFTSGKPTTLYGACDPNYRVSRLPFIYFPANYTGFNIGYSINTDSNNGNGVRMQLYRIVNNALPTFTFNLLTLNFTSGSNFDYIPTPSAPPVPAGTTQYLTAQRVGGASLRTLEVISHYIQTK